MCGLEAADSGKHGDAHKCWLAEESPERARGLLGEDFEEQGVFRHINMRRMSFQVQVITWTKARREEVLKEEILKRGQ